MVLQLKAGRWDSGLLLPGWASGRARTSGEFQVGCLEQKGWAWEGAWRARGRNEAAKVLASSHGLVLRVRLCVERVGYGVHVSRVFLFVLRFWHVQGGTVAEFALLNLLFAGSSATEIL